MVWTASRRTFLQLTVHLSFGCRASVSPVFRPLTFYAHGLHSFGLKVEGVLAFTDTYLPTSIGIGVNHSPAGTCGLRHTTYTGTHIHLHAHTLHGGRRREAGGGSSGLEVRLNHTSNEGSACVLLLVLAP